MHTLETNSRSSSPVSIVGTLLLVIIVTVAVYFRFTGLSWDENQHLHPDERFLTMVETALQPIGAPEERLGPPPTGRAQLRDCKAWGGYFDTACSPLNPVNRGHGYYVYGTLPIFLVRYVGEALDLTSYGHIHRVGRMLSALADIITLLLLFATARLLYGEKVALLAAALFAATVLPIQQSHFFTVDNFTVMFVVTTFYFAVRAQHRGRWLDFAVAGLFLGAAAACKISVWPMAGIVTLTAALWWTGGPRRPIEFALFKLALAGILAMLAFRVFQPYAFAGPNFWNVSLDPGWRATMESIQKLINGEQDAPFAHQWANRAPVAFSWLNMVVWGMGLPLGLTAWAGWAFVGYQIALAPRLPGKTGLPNPQPPNPQGSGSREGDSAIHWRVHLLPWLWATGFFIYQSTQWTKSIRYLLPVYPFFIVFAAYMLMNLKFTFWRSAISHPSSAISHQQSGIRNPQSTKWANVLLTAIVLVGTLAWAWGFTRIYARPVTRAAASRWIYQNVPTAATLRYQTENGEEALQLNISPQVTYTHEPYPVSFKVPMQATLTSLTMNKLSDPVPDEEPETFRVTISEDVSGQNVVAQTQISVHLEQAPAGDGSYLLEFPPATSASLSLQPGREYYFIGQAVEGGPILARSSALGNEHWDDGIPLRVDGRDGFSIYHGVQLQNYNEDDENKLASLVSWLSQTDYINLTSNRLYPNIPRLPTRYPMTSEYYRALFSGRLGFEKIAEFTSYITIGPFEFPDQESTEMLGIPNPFDRTPGRIQVFLPPAEEAFSVYDHPRVAIYRKTADFSPEKVAQILGKFDLSQVIRLWPKQVTKAPTALMLDPEVWEKQQGAGTWSQLYNRDGLLNRFPLLAILAWWLLLFVLGALAWPLIAFAWPALPDRGWGLARTLGLLIVGYLSWLAASLGLMTFGRGTLLAAILVLAALSAACAFASARKGKQPQIASPHASRITYHVSALRLRFHIHRTPLAGTAVAAGHGITHHLPPRHLLLIEEAVFAFVFLILLLIRYGNGDLWHFYLGGERPMDFAYLNAVLKSVYFPPYDPWFAGGQMNYYYFGFVLISVPIKLLGIVPALAYNIALPMLAALTAIGAFSVAFNISTTSDERRTTNTQAIGIGLLAALFVVFLGNLGELKLILDALAELGRSDLRSTIPGLVYTVSWMRGLIALIGGQSLPVHLDWWYWNASRLMKGSEINEFPFFTFLYSDLHAHMIAFPLTVLLLGIGLGWVLRRRWNSVDAAVSLLIGALVVGAARANNTWDYPTYLAIAFIALFASGIQTARHSKPSSQERGMETTPTIARKARQRSILTASALLSGALALALFGAAWFIFGGIDDIPTFVMISALLLVIGQLTHRLLEKTTNDERRTTNDEQATSNNQRAIRRTARAASNEQSAGRRKLPATSNEQQATSNEQQATSNDSLSVWRWIDVAYIAIMGLSILYFYPYVKHYATAYSNAEVWKGSRTPLNIYILIHGIFLFPIATYLLTQVRRSGWRWYAAAVAVSRIWREAIVSFVILGIIIWVGIAALGYSVILIAGPLIALAILVLVRPRLPVPQRYVTLLVTLALVITFAVEVIVLRGDIGRMNTVFKFYLQVWIIFGIAAAAVIGWLSQAAARRWSPGTWLGWQVGMAALVVCGLLYPLYATRAKIRDRFDPTLGPTLDAMKFMTVAHANEKGQDYAFADEYEALIWMQDNIQGTPVVAGSAAAPEYRSLRNRVSTYTGLPALIGYNWHQRQQRSILPGEVIDRRVADTNDLYLTLDVNRALQIIEKYNVRYIMAGYPERLYYPPGGIAKFGRMVSVGLLRVAYENESVTIYEVVK